MIFLAIFLCAIIMGMMCDRFMAPHSGEIFGTAFVVAGFSFLFYGVVYA